MNGRERSVVEAVQVYSIRFNMTKKPILFDGTHGSWYVYVCMYVFQWYTNRLEVNVIELNYKNRFYDKSWESRKQSQHTHLILIVWWSVLHTSSFALHFLPSFIHSITHKYCQSLATNFIQNFFSQQDGERKKERRDWERKKRLSERARGENESLHKLFIRYNMKRDSQEFPERLFPFGSIEICIQRIWYPKFLLVTTTQLFVWIQVVGMRGRKKKSGLQYHKWLIVRGNSVYVKYFGVPLLGLFLLPYFLSSSLSLSLRFSLSLFLFLSLSLSLASRERMN